MKEESNNQKNHNTIQEFLLYYEAVFNEDGSIKLCGREKCKKLIEISEELCVKVEPEGGSSKEALCPKVATGEFGSKETGFIYEVAVKALKELIDVWLFMQDNK